MQTRSHKRGFTLIELIVVFAIVSIISTLTATAYIGSRTAGDANRAAFIYATVLADAARRAEVMENDMSWGVKVTATSTTLFSGSSYVTRTMANDIVYRFGSNLTVSGLTETIFTKYTGLPTITGTTTFANTFATRNVAVWPGGIIEN